MQAAYQNDCYDEMVDFLRSVFSSSLKTNDALEKGIMTGCLRISKESIFTGLNNFSSYSILDNIANEYFGFTTTEVEQLMNGQSIIKDIKAELTYREMDNINNICSFLLLTGYLKAINDLGNQRYELVISNREIYEIYKQSFMSYFMPYTDSRQSNLDLALKESQIRTVNNILNDILPRFFSYYDNKESFYHVFNIKSNREAGDEKFDICIYPETVFERLS